MYNPKCKEVKDRPKNQKGDKNMVKVIDKRDGTVYECRTMADAINLCVHDWNCEVLEEE